MRIKKGGEGEGSAVVVRELSKGKSRGACYGEKNKEKINAESGKGVG